VGGGPDRTVGNLDQIGGVSLDTLLADVDTEADYAMAHSYGGYSTNLPLEDLLDGKAWVAIDYDGEKLAAEHGGPARFLVPHLYFWEIGQVGSRH
jgi:DMSO/TMAO reductase YedYZ molybdopterin-dependent catalytic subunit